MTITEIKNAVDNNKTVHWMNTAYKVIKDDIGQYLIICNPTNSCIGLTDKSGKNLNGKETEFFIL